MVRPTWATPAPPSFNQCPRCDAPIAEGGKLTPTYASYVFSCGSHYNYTTREFIDYGRSCCNVSEPTTKEIIELLHVAQNFPMDPRHRMLLAQAASRLLELSKPPWISADIPPKENGFYVGREFAVPHWNPECFKWEDGVWLDYNGDPVGPKYMFKFYAPVPPYESEE